MRRADEPWNQKVPPAALASLKRVASSAGTSELLITMATVTDEQGRWHAEFTTSQGDRYLSPPCDTEDEAVQQQVLGLKELQKACGPVQCCNRYFG